jgi:hypothetical protein
MPVLRYLMMAAALLLVSLVSFLIYKYRNLLRRKEAVMKKEDVVGRLFQRNLRKIGDQIGKEDPGELFKRLKRTMRSFFSELFEIKYEFAYVELNEELSKKGVNEKIRNDVINYTMQMAEAEYGRQEISDERVYILLEKSIRIVGKITGYSPEMAPAELLEEKKPEKKEIIPEKEKPPAKPEEKKPEEKPPEKEEEKPEKEEEPPEKKEEWPREEKPITEEKVKEFEKEITIPEKEEERIDKLRKLLFEAEENIKQDKPETAVERYSEMKEIYDSLSPQVKRKIYPETKRVIAVYNSLLKKYKEFLTIRK